MPDVPLSSSQADRSKLAEDTVAAVDGGHREDQSVIHNAGVYQNTDEEGTTRNPDSESTSRNVAGPSEPYKTTA